jgi:hypothetical protein
MATRRETNEDPPESRRPAAKTPEARENQLISLAVDLAEKQLREGTASSQTISHYLKLGSTREQLEQERLANENLLLKARTDQIEAQKNYEALYVDAINAMRTYSTGRREIDPSDD